MIRIVIDPANTTLPARTPSLFRTSLFYFPLPQTDKGERRGRSATEIVRPAEGSSFEPLRSTASRQTGNVNFSSKSRHHILGVAADYDAGYLDFPPLRDSDMQKSPQRKMNEGAERGRVRMTPLTYPLFPIGTLSCFPANCLCILSSDKSCLLIGPLHILFPY